MAISDVDICNLALMNLGIEMPIQSLTDDSNNARYCNRFYAPMRDAVLRSHPWNCAVHRRIITAESDTPDSDWNYQFLLPVNPYCLRVLQVGAAEDQPVEWRVEGRRLLTFESSMPIVYIKRITDTNEFDPLLVDAISIKLAIRMAMPLTKDQAVKDSLIKELELVVLPLARTIDAQETSTQGFIVDDWMKDRY